LIAPPDGAASHLALQVAGRTGVPVISLSGDSSVSQTGVRWMARISPRTVEEARALFQRCSGDVHAKSVRRWAALAPTGRAGREIGKDLARGAQTAGVAVPEIIEVGGLSADLRVVSRQVLTNRADGVLLWLAPAFAGSAAKALQQAGFKGRLAGPGWLRCSTFLAAAGCNGPNCLTAVPLLLPVDDLRFREFQREYRARFGRLPDFAAALSHDAALLLIHVLREAGDRPAHQAFPLTFDLPAVTGVLAFDAEGNRKLKLQVSEIGLNPLDWVPHNTDSPWGSWESRAQAGGARQNAATP